MKKAALYLILLFPLSFSACEKEADDEGYITYVIKSGNHSSHNQISLLSGKELRFMAMFDNTAEYSTSDPLNQLDINKLYGFSDCGDQHHQNSARFGWRWYNSKIEIFGYSYNNSVRVSEYITTVDPNKEYEYKISIIDNSYVFTVNGSTLTMNRGCSDGGTKYRLYPYFGGDEKAPHDIFIKIKEI